MESITSYNSLLNLIEEKTNKKVLIHTCCGPCSTTCLELLLKGFNVDIFYYNPNIDTAEEFVRRSNEQIRVSNFLNASGKVIIPEYNQNEFNEAIQGLEYLGEKTLRCYKCYELRLRKTCEYAKKNNYDYWTTSLSISPHKNSDWLNEIGLKLAEEYQIPFLYSNFKLKNGYQKSIIYSKEYNLYRQNYCGCHYSKIERGIINE